MKLFSILNFSDIYIGDTYMVSKDIAYRIISDIENWIYRIGAVLTTLKLVKHSIKIGIGMCFC